MVTTTTTHPVCPEAPDAQHQGGDRHPAVRVYSLGLEGLERFATLQTIAKNNPDLLTNGTVGG